MAASLMVASLMAASLMAASFKNTEDIMPLPQHEAKMDPQSEDDYVCLMVVCNDPS
jgi:hypothetical protein